MYKLTDIYKQIREENSLNKSKYKIYCDMDGVIVDFDKQFEKLSGMPPKSYESKYGIDKFWEIIDKEGYKFWSEMQWMPEGKQLWGYIKKYNPSILSAPSRQSSSRYGKRLWIQKNISGTPLILANRENKKNYAGMDKILIDDREDNCNEWALAGGVSILFKSTSQTINDLKKLNI